jgi:hypothetical protein
MNRFPVGKLESKWRQMPINLKRYLLRGEGGMERRSGGSSEMKEALPSTASF